MEEKVKIDKSTKIKIVIIAVLITLIGGIGISYAFFATPFDTSVGRSSMTVSSANLRISFVDGNVINISEIFPGTTVNKTFSVTNDSDVATYYDIKMQDVFTTFIKDELVYTLTSTNSGGTKSETIMPNNDGLIKAKVLIAADTTQTYTMAITWKEMNDYQNYNQKATYHGKIQIISPYEYTDGSLQNIKLTDRIMVDNTTAYPTNTSSKYVTASTGIDYSKTSDYAYEGYRTLIEDVNFTSNANRNLGTTFSFDNDSGGFLVDGTKGTNKTYSSADIDKYTCYNTNDGYSYYCYQLPQELYKILEVDGSTVTKVERYIAKPNTNSWNGLGLYQTSTNTVGNQPTYFFRGHVLNNYVSFAGDLWRIVRINEDGSIRLIRELNYVSNSYNPQRNNEMYVGYMFGTAEDPYVNTNPTNIKTRVEAYYDSKLASLSSYLAPIEFCNDRTIYNISGEKTYYGVYGRLHRNKAPIFTCPNEERDLFTLTTSTRGNKTLTKSVGLLTQDEAAYAGAVSSVISKYYLDNNTHWWTASPMQFSGSNASMWRNFPGGVSWYNYTDKSHGIRPVISLKADTLVLGGSGSANDPYIITQ